MTKLYADNRRNAKDSDIQVGDTVLVKRDQKSKLDTPFRSEPFQVVDKTGSSITVESPQGVRYKRNTSFVKRYHQPLENEPDLEPANPISETNAPEVVEQAEKRETPVTTLDESATPTPIRERPVRIRQTPAKLKDYVLG